MEPLAGLFGVLFVLLVSIAPLITLYSIVPFITLYYAIKSAVGGSIRDAAKRDSGDPARPTVRQILDERYARGEIGREEYERMRRDIEARSELDARGRPHQPPQTLLNIPDLW